MLRAYWPVWLSILVLVLLMLVVPVAASDGFAYCVNHDGQYYLQDAAKDKPPSISRVDVKSTWVFGSCLGSFANENGIGITALATILLTAATGLLAWLAFIQTINGHRQLRAYVFVDSGNLYDGTVLNPQIPTHFGVPGVGITIKNSGQTPAKDVISYAAIDVIEPRHENTLAVPNLDKKFALSLGAGGSFPKSLWHTRALNAQEIADVLARAKGIYVFGRIIYKDIFGVEHFTNFRFVYFGPFPSPTGTMTFNTCVEGNDFD